MAITFSNNEGFGVCLSADVKPSLGVQNGDMLLEMDTGKVCLFDSENQTWRDWTNEGAVAITAVSKIITSNGTYTAPQNQAFTPVEVNVPNTYAAGDEGKVVSSGALVAQTAHATVTSNGTVTTTTNNSVPVAVPPYGTHGTINEDGTEATFSLADGVYVIKTGETGEGATVLFSVSGTTVTALDAAGGTTVTGTAADDEITFAGTGITVAFYVAS